MIDFRMPSLGADMEDGTLVEWLVRPGDTVRRGDVVAVVETQKGAIEIEIFTTGVVAEILVPVGALVPVGSVLARVAEAAQTAATAEPSPRPSPATADAPVRATAAHARPDTPAPPATPAAPTASPPRAAPQETPAPAPAVPAPPAPDQAAARRRASPAARRLAADRGIDLALLAGSGPDGAVVIADIEQAARSTPARPATRRTGFDPAAMRQAIAAAMSRSKREIPHYYLSQTIDVSAALAELETLNRDRPPTARVLPAALFLRAVATALARTPELNGFWEDGRFRPGDGIHVGWAIALRGGGLVAPAIRDADRRSLDDLMAALRDLVARARGSGLRGSELTAGTVTVTSLGDRGAETVWPIIQPPQVAMLGIGRIVTRPWVVGAAIQPRQVVTLTLAADHRASDGHRGGLLLAGIETLLQEPLPS